MTNDLETLIETADELRDAGNFIAAADAYWKVLGVDPSLSWVWVQLANMEKDAGRYPAAIDAYTKALEAEADPADTLLQMARALKLSGDRSEAVNCFEQALSHDPTSLDIAEELADCNESWSVQKKVGLGFPLYAEMRQSLVTVTESLHRIEQALPALERFASIPVSEYNLFRELYRAPPPPPKQQQRVAVVFVDVKQNENYSACFETLSSQSTGKPSVFHFQNTTGNKDSLAEFDWIVIAREAVFFNEHALGWFTASDCKDDVALYADEDVVSKELYGKIAGIRPILKGKADPELLDQGIGFGSVLSVRADVFRAWGEANLGSKENEYPDADWISLCKFLFATGNIRHIPEVLSSRLDTEDRQDDSKARAISNNATGRRITGKATGSIAVIIPTRDGGETLGRSISSLQQTAAHPEQLHFVILDNGSREAATLEILNEYERQLNIAVHPIDEPFNWSALSNLGVRQSTDPHLLFMNDDIETTSQHWDARLIDHLSRPEIGAVGARLLYPDQTLQHAGIILGCGVGNTEHEGRNHPATDGGPENRWLTRRTVSAITGAWFGCRRGDFEQIGGFDDRKLPIWFSDVDLCLQFTQRGMRVIYEPQIEAFHHESKTLSGYFQHAERDELFLKAVGEMRNRWGQTLLEDPYYNNLYARWADPFTYLAPARIPVVDGKYGV